MLKSGNQPDEFYKIMWDTINSGKSWAGTFQNRKKNGELFWESANISPIYDSHGSITHYIAVKEDITAKVNAEKELRSHKEHLEQLVEERTKQINAQNIFLRTLIDTIPGPVFVKDADGIYTDVNTSFEKNFEVKREDIIGKDDSFIFSEENCSEIKINNKKVLEEEPLVLFDIEHKNKTGKEKVWGVWQAAFGRQDKGSRGITGMCIDFTEQKILQRKTDEALAAEKAVSEMKTSFISIASHEFRTPLTTILSSADLLDRYGKNWPELKYQEMILKIQEAVGKMNHLLDEVLTLNRIERGKIPFIPAMTNLEELINKCLSDVSPFLNNKHKIETVYCCGRSSYLLDGNIIYNCLNNLLTNAIKYSPNGGIIKVSSFCGPEGLTISVSDEGIGIPKEDLIHMFEPFFRAKNTNDIKGYGLGLSIVKQNIELHGGTVSIQSKVNNGTTVTLNIPAK